MRDGNWRPLTQAFEYTVCRSSTDPEQLASIRRLARSVAEQATQEARIELHGSATHAHQFPEDESITWALSDRLRKLAHPCVPRMGPVVVGPTSAFPPIHKALQGLEHRVHQLHGEDLLNALSIHPAAVLLHVRGPADLDVAARLRVDSRSVGLPLIVLAARDRFVLPALGVGVDAVFPADADLRRVAGAIGTMLGQSDPLASAGNNRLPDRTAFLQLLGPLVASARNERLPYSVVMAQPLHLDTAIDRHGPEIVLPLVEDMAQRLRNALGEMTRVFQLDTTTVAWTSRAPRRALLKRLHDVCGPETGRWVETEGHRWNNRMAVGGIEVVDSPIEKTLAGARRMLSLSLQSEGASPVLTPLDVNRTIQPRILVLEPDTGTTEVIRRSLETDGFDIVRCTEPMDALGHLRSNTFDLVLTAVDHPKAIRVVRGLANVTDAPILALVRELGDGLAALRNGAQDLVHKPIEPALFLARIRARLSPASN